ncbi:hypothetical protein N7523_006138 [Penicillium sp. IBT 18751x]|nr:hypothetical protein N7523_006138 [Penicillium sp. IBT 18751x]
MVHRNELIPGVGWFVEVAGANRRLSLTSENERERQRVRLIICKTVLRHCPARRVDEIIA